jgi:hypothetical protein
MLLHTGKREINALRDKCSSVERGWEWVGTVGTLEEHVATCGFILVYCPKQCRDDTDAVKCFTYKDLGRITAIRAKKCIPNFFLPIFILE